MQRFFCLLLCLLPVAGWANHIIGGDISLLALDKNKSGYYRIQVIQYWETSALNGTSNQDPIVNILIFRKRNPVLMEKLQVDLRTTTPLVYNNAACASQFNLRTTQATYYRDYQFDISRYTDTGGYYIVWERCCRNNAMVNLANSANIGMMLYMEFPALSRNASPYINSSPQFSLPNGDYICINKPFTFDFSATDADGDALKYSLVTPLQGYTTAQQLNPDDSPKSAYPTVTWGQGYSEQNAIPGNPPLQINPNTGLLSIKADRQGIFLFTVQVEEYRNGQRIGLVRRDFQFPVIDCNKSKPPLPVVLLNGQPTTEVSLCGNQTVTLTVDNNLAYTYQWRLAGINLSGVTSFSTVIADTGTYTVAKRFANTCGGDTISPAVHVKRISPPVIQLSTSSLQPFCVGDTITLQVTGQTGNQYQWSRDGQSINNNRSTLRAFQTGTYKVIAQSSGTTCPSQDTLRLLLSPKPEAQLQVSAPTFCKGDSVKVTLLNEPGYTYQWSRDGTVISSNTNSLVTTLPGVYRVKVSALTGCSTVTSTTIAQVVKPDVFLDSIPPICGPNSPAMVLQGKPSGGQYSGPGIQANQFNPAVAGVGRHEIVYAVTLSTGCRNQQSRWVDVSPALKLTVKPMYTVTRGDTIHLLAVTDSPQTQFHWKPTTYLDRASTSNPICAPDAAISYTVSATSPLGCTASATVEVMLAERLYIPSAFSPNNDGLNDRWEIKNIDSYPDCEVSVYNRWGEVIFHSDGYRQPWEGTYQNQRIDPGVYTYIIRTGDRSPLFPNYTTRGQVIVVH